MADAPRPNILIYFLDELRADALGCYGHPFVRTPAIDRIAAAGMRFDRGFSSCPLCMPARNTLFTGLYAPEHGVTCNALPADLETRYAERPPLYAFGQILRAAGYERIVDVGKHHTGLDRSISGFTEEVPFRRNCGPASPPAGVDPEQNDLVRIPGQAPNTIIAGTHPGDGSDYEPAALVDAALPALDRLQAAGEPWVMRASFVAPHTPVLAPEPYHSMYTDEVADWTPPEAPLATRTDVLHEWRQARGFDRLSPAELRHCRQTYYGLVSFVDAQIARLEDHLQARGLDENLLTIFVADHGNSIGDHGLQVKGPYDTADIARVPLVVRWPGRVAPGVHEGFAQLEDLMPTLADLLGVKPAAPLSGVSLRPVLEGDPTPVRDCAYGAATWPHCNVAAGRRESLRTVQWLYTRYPDRAERELFDLEADPAETRNVAAERPRLVAEFDARLDAFRQAHGERVDLTRRA